MKNIFLTLLLPLIIVTGCVANAPPTPYPHPVDSEWLNPEPCVVGLMMKWSDGGVTLDRVPEDMICSSSV
jgi:hypothetical protein